MRHTRPASFGWLLAHEMRVALRARQTKAATRWIGYAVIAVIVGFGLLTAKGLAGTPIPATPMALLIVLTATIALFSFMTTQAVLGSQRTLYEAGDLDLLFSAPIAPRTVLMAKLCGIAGTIVLTFAIFLLPFAVPVAALGHPGLFGVIPLLAAVAMVAACLGLAITLVLARIAGPRAARTVGQVAAALLGGAVFLTTQIVNAGEHRRQSSWQTLFERLRDDGFGASYAGQLPGRAAFGDPVAIVLLFGSALALFLVTGLIFRRLFERGVADAGQHLNRRTASTKAIARHFRAGLFASIMAKEVTLLRRDPALTFRILLRLIYLIPLMLIGFRSDHHLPLAPGLAFFSVTIAGQLVGSFAWLAVSAEDAPDLITVAPVDKAEIDRAKLGAAMAIAAPIALLVPIAIATISPIAALIAILFTAAGGAAAGMIELKLGKPAPRSNFNRQRPGSFVTRLLTLMVTIVLGAISGIAVYFVG
ncbi:putative ABC exporter domain-containing protein [Hephaestia sp. CMS5P-6]|nr:putative ABC exporter domain-containing protein [Hephaestia mangrovi]MBY8828451.1 putative ABC exporter domain-containing protein [Hephaestia mangrovi]